MTPPGGPTQPQQNQDMLTPWHLQHVSSAQKDSCIVALEEQIRSLQRKLEAQALAHQQDRSPTKRQIHTSLTVCMHDFQTYKDRFMHTMEHIKVLEHDHNFFRKEQNLLQNKLENKNEQTNRLLQNVKQLQDMLQK